MNHFSDEQLAVKYKKGDEVALEILVKRYLPIIFNFSRRYVGDKEAASDIAQEVFVKVWKNINKFDDSKKFKTWIFTLAKNTAIDWLREKKALPFSMFEQADGNNFLDDLADNSPSIIEQISQKLTGQQLSVAVAQLPEKYGSVINMHMQNQLTFKEIAWMLEEPLNTVKSRYRRGLISLKTVLQNNPNF
jgi:RNA polymerase sigma-70 factor (ECF subfamily)